VTGTLKALDAVRRFITEGGFPSLFLAVLLYFELMMIALLVTPPAPTGFGAFAEDFRVWCFGYDPATGITQWIYAMGMLGPPLMLGGFVTLVWWEPLRELARRPGALLRSALVAALLMGAAALGMSTLSRDLPDGELPFPAEALRTSLHPPNLLLTSHEQLPVDLAALKGKVVLLTAMYASCGHTCPLLLSQSKEAVAELSEEEQRDLRVVAVTMDPENDTPAVLAGLANHHDMAAPLFNLVTGEPARVEKVLDQMGIARSRNPETGVIDHANLFLLIDREGTVAYRLGLGERQKRWLVSALRLLLREGRASS